MAEDKELLTEQESEYVWLPEDLKDDTDLNQNNKKATENSVSPVEIRYHYLDKINL
jgi:hypothetical protein